MNTQLLFLSVYLAGMLSSAVIFSIVDSYREARHRKLENK